MMFLLILIGLVSATPFLTAFTLSYALRIVGWSLRRKTQGRRELILSRVRIEEEEWLSRQKNSQKAEDEDWEKVEGYSAGTAPNGGSAGADWEGVVGFFHPFW